MQQEGAHAGHAASVVHHSRNVARGRGALRQAGQGRNTPSSSLSVTSPDSFSRMGSSLLHPCPAPCKHPSGILVSCIHCAHTHSPHDFCTPSSWPPHSLCGPHNLPVVHFHALCPSHTTLRGLSTFIHSSTSPLLPHSPSPGPQLTLRWLPAHRSRSRPGGHICSDKVRGWVVPWC